MQATECIESAWKTSPIPGSLNKYHPVSKKLSRAADICVEIWKKWGNFKNLGGNFCWTNDYSSPLNCGTFCGNATEIFTVTKLRNFYAEFPQKVPHRLSCGTFSGNSTESFTDTKPWNFQWSLNKKFHRDYPVEFSVEFPVCDDFFHKNFHRDYPVEFSVEFPLDDDLNRDCKQSWIKDICMRKFLESSKTSNSKPSRNC